MKYKISNEAIPQEKRKEINEKILYLLNNELCEQTGITQQDIFDSYTGDGHLHGLNFKDFNNYHEFSEAKKEIENGQFYTHPNVLNFISKCVRLKKSDIVADLTSGRGDFFNFCPTQENCYSNELDIKSYKVQKHLYPKINLTYGDIRQYATSVDFDFIFSNPPFGLSLKYEGIDYKSEILCVKKANEFLKPLGILALLIPQSFCQDTFMNKSDFYFLSDRFYFLCEFNLPNNSFKHVGINSFPTKVIFLQKKSEHYKQELNQLKKIEILNFEDVTSDMVYNEYLLPAFERKEKLKLKTMREAQSKLSDNFSYKVKKMRFDIARHQKTKSRVESCDDYLNKFYTQTKPETMSYEDWEKTKITENKVIAYFKRVLKKQSEVEKDVIRLVKTNKELKLKAYSRKTKIELSKMETNKKENINSLVYHGNYPFENEKYLNLIQKKIKQFELQSLSFKEMKEDMAISDWLKKQYFYDSDNETTIRLNEKQCDIANLMLQKDYGYIQASQGSGKTLMGLYMAKYRMEKQGVKNTIVVAPAIAIKGTWNYVLPTYGLSYVQISKRSDFNNIKDGDIILVTFNMMCKYQREIKKFIKIKSKKIYTIVDEADNICNLSSKRYKATMSGTFKSKYKTCLSGTMARNNITEAFTQLLYLYGSSYNFVCDCETVYKKGKNNELEGESNEFSYTPYRMYKGGYSLFRSCYNPEKITVMGIEQQNQDIYNPDSLKKLCDKTIITKSFEEIIGKKIYTLNQNLIPFTDSEKQLYKIAIENFMDMKYLFNSTGNARKDKMLEILQQLNLLLDICRFPQNYKEYQSDELPNKFQKVLSMLKQWDNEYVAIGCRTLKEVELYTSMIQDKMPDRELYVITGSVDIENRKKIINQLKKSRNGILLSTQQSLSSSMNIPFVNKILITSVPWNMASLSQYYFRFIRYNSIDDKEIHFVMYKDSLECNLLGLLMSKEKLVRFLKDENINEEQLNEEFGVDFDLLSMLLKKEKDENNKIRINWGKSNL